MITKHKTTQNKQKPKKNQKPKPEAKPTFGKTELTGQVEAPNTALNSTIQAQRLNDTHLQTTQRQALAKQIGRIQGNRALQKLLTPGKHNVQRKSKGTTASGIVQLSELSDEMAEIWQRGDKGQFFDRLRNLNTPDQDLSSFIEQSLAGDDQWLAQNLLAHGRETEWPLPLKIEREMKGWSDSGGIPAVLNLLPQATAAEKQEILKNTDLMTKIRSNANPETEFVQIMKSLVDVTNLPPGPIQDATALLAGGEHEIDRNTAQLLINGDVATYYFDDLEEHPDTWDILLKARKEPMTHNVYFLPGTTDYIILKTKGVRGFATEHNGKKLMFINKPYPIDEIKLSLIHEVNHLQNPKDPSGDPILEKYQTEFRAYWVAEYRDITDLDDRAAKVKQHVLAKHPDVANAYYSDKKIMKAIDSYKRPNGNVTNQ